MKTGSIKRSAVGMGVIALIALGSFPASGQTPPMNPEQLQQLVLEIAEQNRQIELNQKAIDAKVAEIEELVRQARIYAARAGKKGGT